MLRHLTLGYRDFQVMPDLPSVRYNWVFVISHDGKISPKLDPPRPGVRIPSGANFFIIPPDTRYVIVAKQAKCLRTVFHYAYVSDVLERVVTERGILAMKLNQADLAQVREITRSVEPHFRNPTELGALYFELALLRLTILALRDVKFNPTTPLGSIGKKRVQGAVAWYAAHIGEAPSLSDIAQIVHVSPTQLRRHFYEEFGKSPKSVFIKMRMQRASQLLSTTSDTLAQIAQACGFQSATDFCRSFKKAFKVTPNCWRHQVNKSKRFDQNSLIIRDLLYNDEAKFAAKSAPANGGVPPRAGQGRMVESSNLLAGDVN